MKDFQFIYKIHPTEESYFRGNIDNRDLESFNNLKFADNKFSIYKLIAESKYVLGVSSAALFEACFFGCEILLLNLPGVEAVSSLFEKEKVILIETDENLLNYL